MTNEIIIVNWNNRQETLECLAAVTAQTSEVGSATVTVVDNGSSDGSASAIASRHPQVKLFALTENRGFTGGLHAALAGSTADHVVFLNNDAIPQKGWLSALVRAMESAPPDVVSVGGQIVDSVGEHIDFIGGMLTFDGHAFQNGFRFPVGSREMPADGAEILFACGGNMISRRALLTDLGGFDDDYFAYLEDVDFGWRTWLAGYRVLYSRDALVRHASSLTSNRLGDFERGVLFERNALQTAIKNYENLAEAGGALFFAYLHRLHHYATTYNADVSELRRPFGGEKKKSSRRLRILRRITRRPLLAAIEDPLTAMQFRAFDWISSNGDRLAAKRVSVQQLRKRSDVEIFTRFPLHVVPTYPGDEALLRSPLFQMLRSSLPSIDKELGDIIRR
jgi:GT2 family glycosyltransferase